MTCRHPGLLAKIVTTFDELSGGRAVLGLGAAWYQREHTGLRVPFPPTGERIRGRPNLPGDGCSGSATACAGASKRASRARAGFCSSMDSTPPAVRHRPVPFTAAGTSSSLPGGHPDRQVLARPPASGPPAPARRTSDHGPNHPTCERSTRMTSTSDRVCRGPPGPRGHRLAARVLSAWRWTALDGLSSCPSGVTFAGR
ncbi:LLM class flavin-dependent oxidoreductase [Streptomyces sp. NBC_01390]|uniref:LLM class flavin-dependent oxidoreductase n=1 Tax=Streptomyces sp. NBC_01390 TaxID=2903850 RepID=UPI00386B1799